MFCFANYDGRDANQIWTKCSRLGALSQQLTHKLSGWTSWKGNCLCIQREKKNNSDFLLFETWNRFSHTSRFQSRWRLSFQIHCTDPLQNIYITLLYSCRVFKKCVVFILFYNNNLTDFLSKNLVFRFLVLPKLEKISKKTKNTTGLLGETHKITKTIWFFDFRWSSAEKRPSLEIIFFSRRLRRLDANGFVFGILHWKFNKTF